MQTANYTAKAKPESRLPSLILASGSPYRKSLLSRLALPFTVHVPDVDELQRPGEPARELVQRLSEAKAATVAGEHSEAIVIGSDQVAVHDGELIGKPGSAERAIAQLRRFSGNRITFLTGVSVLHAAAGYSRTAVVPTRVVFRSLSGAEIRRYVEQEMPLDCAGSFRAELLGISLFERLDSDDPTALVGLPLICLSGLLREAGLQVP